MAADDFGEFLARTNNATRRSLADVVAADQIARMSDSDFDDALWLALCGHVDDVETLRTLPTGVRMYFATRLVEWEAGSGGFDSAIDIAAEYFEDAMEGYRLLNDRESVELWERVQGAAHDPDLLDQLMDEVEGPPWHGIPWGDAARIAYVRAHPDEFRI